MRDAGWLRRAANVSASIRIREVCLEEMEGPEHWTALSDELDIANVVAAPARVGHTS